MTWAKLDDLYDDHPKVKRAWRLSGYAVGLHTSAITASCRHESDGLVDPEWLADKLAHLPRTAARRAIDVLVSLELFEPLPAGAVASFDDGKGFTVTIGPLLEDAHVVHDFLDYNDSSAFLADRRQRDADRKRGRRGDSRRIPTGVRAESNGTPNDERPESEHPDPTRPDQTLETPQPPQAGEHHPQGSPSALGLALPSSLDAPQPPLGDRKTDHAKYRRALAEWHAGVASFFSSPAAAPTDGEASRVIAAVGDVLRQVPAGSQKATALEALHAHHYDGDLLLLGTGTIPSWQLDNLRPLLDRALPPGTRWRLVECGCSMRLERAA